MPTSTLILQHSIRPGWLPRLTPIPRRLSPTARAVGLVLFTPTALRRGDRIDHTNQQETGPEPDLKAPGAQLSHAKQLRGNGSPLQQWCLHQKKNTELKGLVADLNLQERCLCKALAGPSLSDKYVLPKHLDIRLADM